MKLQQLKYLIAIRDHNLNVSVASDALYTSQPGVSKQIGLLESELGVRIFERRGKHLHRITPVGEEIIKCAEAMLNIESKIKAISREYLDPTVGTLNIHTTHTIARYLLPKSVTYFTKKYPKISFHLHPVMSASKEQISKGYSDFSIVAHEIGFDKELIALPAYLWTLSLVVPQDHPLARVKKPTLEQLCQYPVLSYESGATGRQVQDDAFQAAGLSPSYYMTVMDAGVIKRYVELGFGIGIISSLVANDTDSPGLVSINLEHLFKPCPAQICFSKSILLQNYMYDFISSFSPHLTKEMIQNVMQQPTQARIDELMAGVELPIY